MLAAGVAGFGTRARLVRPALFQTPPDPAAPEPVSSGRPAGVGAAALPWCKKHLGRMRCRTTARAMELSPQFFDGVLLRAPMRAFVH
jgi:hypothetical protein